jgi:hypothetical protein
MPAINDDEPVPRPKAPKAAASSKKGGQDSVVPPINVLIVEGKHAISRHKLTMQIILSIRTFCLCSCGRKRSIIRLPKMVWKR